MLALTSISVPHSSIPINIIFHYVKQQMILNIHSDEHFFKKRESGIECFTGKALTLIDT